MPTDSHPPTNATHREAPLCCPGCGYNLTGVCTAEKPEGTCPECGRAFERGALFRLQQTQHRNRPNLIVGLLVWPVVYAVAIPILIGCLADALFTGVNDAIAFVVLVSIPLLACGLSGYSLARRATDAKRVGRDADEVPAFYRHMFWPWLLFMLTHLVLTAVFFFGGCALILIAIFGL